MGCRIGGIMPPSCWRVAAGLCSHQVSQTIKVMLILAVRRGPARASNRGNGQSPGRRSPFSRPTATYPTAPKV
jgi:hypothetical protein